MKRWVPVGMALVVAGLVGPASAATTYLAVEDLGVGVTALNVQCADPSQFTTFNYTSHAAGPETPPLGTGSLRIDTITGYYSGIQFGGADLSALTPGSFAVTAYPATAADEPVHAYVRVSTTANGVWVGLASTGDLARDDWNAEQDFTALQFDWDKVTTADVLADTTIADFVTAKGTGTFFAAVLASGCDTQEPYYIDRLRGVSLGEATTWDYEKVYATALTNSTSTASVRAGSEKTVLGQLTSTGLLVNGRTVHLLADTFPPGGGFTDVGTDGTSFEGFLSSKQKPLRATTYRWSFTGVTYYGPSTSSDVTVQVRTAVSAKLADAFLKRGERVVLTGATNPKKAGVQVQLWRKTATGAKLLKTGTTKSDGTYRLAKQLLRKGTYKVYVAIGATPGNLPGTSQLRTTKVT
ncbi:MAG TPA: hypothetical protein VLI04_19415 [Nocardioidaceae bacterium]|nr:hypothetical protein [Nocardioidaceae bacterium]